ncbi:MAG: phosphoglycerate dehydrogenase [Pseudomonadales bacterium]|jgi:D-3-phosphoglycerate dehydrogenase|nr:phosphoglycerate dehydrogenase [Pseudomonadales bacterium]MDP7359462.1 phosphoglycerate dehydrogenase [Pseudomonadales bacterium]MDP7595449.1 phosphoglycerate dehydrogenase [Pseudomonadales bacterium]HJN49682.1 phosphoglycerate dehydrogenase [Pseudomonadales bacterium]|tara:strand:+ start:342 stop:1529 length:1188 start_codon:yes stop_codon:yes gene_type:complete
MYKVRTLNQISPRGLDKFSDEIYELGNEVENPDAILVRSFKLSEDDVGPSLRAVGRAGAGVNNIPVSACTDKGVVVFNTPGANANAVKELVLVAMLLSARGIIDGIDYVKGLTHVTDHDELSKLVEGSKKNYKGSEIAAKTLGVIGLGAIGSLVADMAVRLGMNVVGYDPELSIDGAWVLSRSIQKMDSIGALLSRADMVSLHVPVLDSTRGLINAETLGQCKDGTVLLNFARGELVNSEDLLQAMEMGKISQYLSDFPTPRLLGKKGVTAIPHLGASTEEAEDNCAMMVADQVIDFLENGNIRNSVNFPSLNLGRSGACRIALANRNVPSILSNVLSILAQRNINVLDMSNRSRDDVAYNLIDIETTPNQELVDEIGAIDGVINVRTFGETSSG